MKRAVVFLLSIVIVFSCKNTKNAATQDNIQVTDAINTLTKAEKKEGWQLLFDGSTKKGWHIYQGKSNGSAWTVSDGMLMLDPKEKKDWQTIGGGDIITDAAYENYHLSLEWRISPKGNSGIIFGIQDLPKYEHSWHTGMEMQILDNDGHGDGKIVKHRAGNLYDLIAASSEPVKPVGDWNKAEIKVNKGKLDLYLNGVNIVSTQLWDDNWKALVAGSKFRSMPDFATFKSGHIGLQDHGDPVWFRNIKIRKL
jgi:Domain of Unknown Function (DUF1080)